MNITDINLTNTVANAQLIGALIAIAFLLAFIASTRSNRKASR